MNDKNISAHAGGGSNLLVFILTLGVFGILNTEMGVIGMLPLIADTFQVSVPQAGWVVTIFALVVALSGPIMPVLFSKFDRKTVMLLALGIFIVTSLVAAFTENFAVLLLTRAIPAFFHPVYVSMAFTVAAASVSAQDAPKAVARVFIGVSAGMVLGVPAASFIASEASYSMTMLFFAAVNVVVFVATLFCVPSMPVTGRLTYGEQLQVLKKPVLWYAVAAVIFNNGAVFGFFSYLADFLKVVTVIPFTTISIVLFVFGNVLAGKLLAHNAPVTIKGTPFAIAVVFTLLFALGDQFGAVLGIVLLFGTLTGLSNNNSQYMIVRSAAEVPEFANGLFLSSANTGTAVGTALCGLFIAEMGTRYAVGGAMLCLAAATIAIFMVHSRRMQCRQEPHDFAEQEHLELVESMD